MRIAILSSSSTIIIFLESSQWQANSRKSYNNEVVKKAVEIIGVELLAHLIIGEDAFLLF